MSGFLSFGRWELRLGRLALESLRALGLVILALNLIKDCDVGRGDFVEVEIVGTIHEGGRVMKEAYVVKRR